MSSSEYLCTSPPASAELSLHLVEHIVIWELDDLALAKPAHDALGKSGETIFVKSLSKVPTLNAHYGLGLVHGVNVTVSRWPLKAPSGAAAERQRRSRV
jgi:hypothetical protein